MNKKPNYGRNNYKKKYKNTLCQNCGREDCHIKTCKEPKNSMGIILYKIH